jgi:hypothetical protein
LVCFALLHENASTNALSTFACWQLVSTYLLAYALLVELKAANEFKLVLIGTLLLCANLVTLLMALYLQVSEGDRRVKLALTLAENELREAELLHEQDQMKADIEELLKRTGLKLELSSSAVESSEPIGKAAKMQEAIFAQAIAECNDFPSFATRKYPCWVISLTNLKAFDELPQHELCIDALEELQADSVSPSCAYSFFISQNWEGGRPGTQSARQPSPTCASVRDRPHPDNLQNTKVWRAAFVRASVFAISCSRNLRPVLQRLCDRLTSSVVVSLRLLPRPRVVSCAGSSASSNTWPCRADARCGFGSISFRYHNALATCRCSRSTRFARTPSCAQGQLSTSSRGASPRLQLDMQFGPP